MSLRSIVLNALPRSRSDPAHWDNALHLYCNAPDELAGETPAGAQPFGHGYLLVEMECEGGAVRRRPLPAFDKALLEAENVGSAPEPAEGRPRSWPWKSARPPCPPRSFIPGETSGPAQFPAPIAMPYACEFETNARRPAASALHNYAAPDVMKLHALVARLAELFAAARPGGDDHAQPRPVEGAPSRRTGERDVYGS